MGGGGGYQRLSDEGLSNLAEQAKKELKGFSKGQHNVFISFDTDDLAEVNLLRGQEKSESNEVEFKDWSVKKPYDSQNAEYIKRKIRERIRQCSTTAVYISKNTYKSKWVNWEIKESIEMGKKVVGFYKGTNPPSKLPKAITNNNIKCVQWTHENLKNEL